MFGGPCIRPLALVDEGLGLTIDIEKSSIIFDQPESPPPSFVLLGHKMWSPDIQFPLYSFRCKHTLL